MEHRFSLSAVFALLMCAVSVIWVQQASAQTVAATPPMGWNSWNHFHRTIDDKTVRAQADAMVSSGMRDAGYIYIYIYIYINVATGG